MRGTLTRTLAAALTLAMLAGCGHIVTDASGQPYDFASAHVCKQPDFDPEQVEVRNLGSGAIYIRWRDEAVLLGSSFSNPGMIRARFLRTKPNRVRVEHALSSIDNGRYVRAILAGHSHYDHIGDL